MNVEDIKLGDLVTVDGEEDCDYIVVDLPGWCVIDPYDYKCLDRNDGILGSVTPEKIIAVNGEPVRTVTARRTLVELHAILSTAVAFTKEAKRWGTVDHNLVDDMEKQITACLGGNDSSWARTLLNRVESIREAL